MDTSRLEKARIRLGDAVIDPSVWPDLLEEISAAAGATGAGLLQSDVRTPDIPRSVGVDAEFSAYFQEGWHTADLRYERVMPLIRAGRNVFIDEDIVTPEDIRRHPFYNDFLATQGFRWFAAVAFRAGPALWAVSIQRTIRQHPFEAGDKPLLAGLAQDLTQVATLSTAVGRMILSGAVDALGAVRLPAVAIDRFGFVLNANACAEALFDDQIRIKDRRLHVGDATARSALDTLYDRFRATSDLVSLPCEPIAVRRRDNRPVILRVLPVPPPARVPFLGARAIITLTAVVPRPGPHPDLLVAAFGLTPAEARLASIIAAGRPPEYAAEELGISRSTARNQLKAIFSKTATGRQSELAALLSRI